MPSSQHLALGRLSFRDAPRLQFFLLLVTASGLLSFTTVVDAATKAPGPNRFLGTCLDEAWVTEKETELQVSRYERDANGRLVHPFLQPALQFPRYRLDDPRTASLELFTNECIRAGSTFYGVDASADADPAASARGRSNGTLVLDMYNWKTHALSTMVLAIIAEEVTGYEVSIFRGGGMEISQRMSSVGTGVCTPVHANVEVWTTNNPVSLRVYANESYSAGGVGYFGSSGIYTTHDFVVDGGDESLHSPSFFPGFWMHYRSNKELIDALKVSTLTNNAAYFPPVEMSCDDGVLGCMDHCSKSEACTLREAEGKECLVLVMMYPEFDQGYFQAVLSNLGIPAYFCFLGFDGMQDYVIDAQASGSPVLFYHYEPDLFHVQHANKFERVFLPQTDPMRVQLATGQFGENGYGAKTDNPVDVDFPSLPLHKYAASRIKHFPIGSLLAKFTLTNMDINSLLSEYLTASEDANEVDPDFRAACNWIKNNYDTWTTWLDPLPLCTFDQHITENVTGCTNSDARKIEFLWKTPNPVNQLLPYACDGGEMDLPPPLRTSRSCEWIDTHRHEWSGWVVERPACDSSFYAYTVSNCDAQDYRTITYYWLLAKEDNPLLSAECEGGVELPRPLKLQTSHTCNWIEDRYRKRSKWVGTKPACDSSSYGYRISNCESQGDRTISYHWLLEKTGNSLLSAECEGGEELPLAIQTSHTCEWIDAHYRMQLVFLRVPRLRPGF